MFFLKKNIVDFFSNSRDIFLVFILLQILAAFSVFFVYGTLHNYQEEKADMSLDTYSFSTGFVEDEKTRDVNNIRNVIEKIMDKVGDKVEGITVLGFDNGDGVKSYNGYKDGEITIPTYIGGTEHAEYFTEEDYKKGKHIVLATQNIEVGKKVNIGGEEYEIIGTEEQFGYDDPDSEKMFCIPLNSMPDKISKIIHLYIQFSKRPTESEYEHFCESLKSVYGSELVEIEEIYLDRATKKKEINSMNIIVIIIALVSSLNICIVYNSILEKRRRKNAILQICGCSYRSMCRYLFIEIFILTTISFILGYGLFFFGKMLWFDEAFTYFSMAFNVTTILKLTLAYFATIIISTIILSMVMNKKEPIALLRRSYYV